MHYRQLDRLRPSRPPSSVDSSMAPLSHIHCGEEEGKGRNKGSLHGRDAQSYTRHELGRSL